MKWFFTLNKAAPKYEVYARMTKVAVYTAIQNTSLEPFCIYDGSEDELTTWLKKHDVSVIFHKTPHRKKLRSLSPWHFKAACGCFLRIEIPKIVEKLGLKDEYVFYTDCDVIFMNEVVDALNKTQCKYIAATPDLDYQISIHDLPKHKNSFNSGIMLMNVKNLLEVYNDFNQVIVANINNEKLPNLAYDQGLYNIFFHKRWDNLEPTLNWRPYWQINPQAQILHFHGPKPTTPLKTLLEDSRNPVIYKMANNYSFHKNTKLWRDIETVIYHEV